MRRIILGLVIAGALVAGAHAQIWIMSPASQVGKHHAVAPLTNLRITNTGAFRITNSAANRAVSP